MDSLPAAAAAVIAAHLLDERDLAALAATSRFWRGVLADPALWRQLLRSRFGPAAEAAEASGSQPILVPAENGPAAMQTAARTRDEVVTEAGSACGRAVRVHSVSWLELAARLPGVLPGRYRAAWRLRLQASGAAAGNFGFAGGRIVTRWLPAASEAGAAALHASPPEDILLPMLREDGLRGALWHSAAHEPPEARTTLTLVPRAQLDAAFQQSGSGWFVLHGGPFELSQQSVVYVKFHSPQGHTSGVVFDCVRLERL
ncbi:hypothetical protein ABPG77_010042 [Micractinium sp. CCAP 211/92]